MQRAGGRLCSSLENVGLPSWNCWWSSPSSASWWPCCCLRCKWLARRHADAQCVQNLKQCAMAISHYASAKANCRRRGRWSRSEAHIHVLNWVYPVLSELEQVPIHNQIRTGTLPPPTTIKVLMCPSQGDSSRTDYPLSYVVNGGRANCTTRGHATHVNFDWVENGVFIDKGVAQARPAPDKTPHRRHRQVRRNVEHADAVRESECRRNGCLRRRYTSKSSIPRCSGSRRVSEGTAVPPDPAYDPAFTGRMAEPECADDDHRGVRIEIRYGRPGSYHPGGVNVALCDGTIQWLSDTVDYGVYAVLMTLRGERANDPANTSFTATNPTWQSPSATNYPGTKY